MKAWIAFAGSVLVIVILYWAQAVLVPVALAFLLSFVLAPPVTWLERWLGRVASVIVVVTLVFVMLGLAGWGLMRQLDNLAEDLPSYRANIMAKIADVRGAGKGGTVEKLQETIEEIKTGLEETDVPKGAAASGGSGRSGGWLSRLRMAQSVPGTARYRKSGGRACDHHAVRAPQPARPACSA